MILNDENKPINVKQLAATVAGRYLGQIVINILLLIESKYTKILLGLSC